jgi:hypothetical protein
MKTIHQRGAGYDRPSKHDEVKFQYKIYQQDKVYEQGSNVEVVFAQTTIKPILREILQSMKKQEVTTSSVKPDYVLEHEPER